MWKSSAPTVRVLQFSWICWTHFFFFISFHFVFRIVYYLFGLLLATFHCFIHKEIGNNRLNACSKWALSNSALGVAARHRHTRTRSHTVLDDFCTWLGCASDRFGFRLSLYSFCPVTYLNFRTIFKTLLLIKALFSMRKFNKRVASCRFCNRYWRCYKCIHISIAPILWKVTSPKGRLHWFCVNAHCLKNTKKRQLKIPKIFVCD